MNELAIHEVPFPTVGDQITAIVGLDDRRYVVVKRICENLEIAFQGQLRNLTTTYAHWSGVNIMLTPDQRGRPQELTVIPLDRLPMWLANIKASKVRPELREKIKTYQREAADVLGRYFAGPENPTGLDWQAAIKTMALAIAQIQPTLVAILQKQETQDGRITALERNLATVASTRSGVGRPASSVPHGYSRLIPWARRHKANVPDNERSSQGLKAAGISRRLGYEYIWAQPPGSKNPANYYHPAVLERWLAQYSRANPAYRMPSLFGLEWEPALN